MMTPEQDKHIREMLGIAGSSGFMSWGGVKADKLRSLIEDGLLDEDDTQNGSPSFGTMVEYAEKYPDAYLHGYYTGDNIGIEGVGYSGKMSTEAVYDFVYHFRDADEFDLDEEGAYCWYD